MSMISLDLLAREKSFRICGETYALIDLDCSVRLSTRSLQERLVYLLFRARSSNYYGETVLLWIPIAMLINATFVYLPSFFILGGALWVESSVRGTQVSLLSWW